MYKDFIEIDEHVTDILAIKNSIRNIILTQKGSLPGFPQFGSALGQIIFEPLNSLNESIIQNLISEALDEFEPRVIFESVSISQVPEFNRVILTVEFSYNVLSELNNLTDSVSIPYTIT